MKGKGLLLSKLPRDTAMRPLSRRGKRKRMDSQTGAFRQKEKKGNDGGKNTGPPSLLFSYTQLVIRSPKQKAEGPLGWLCGASSIDLHRLHQSLAPDL